MNYYKISVICLVVFLVVFSVLLSRHLNYKKNVLILFKKLKTLLRNSIKKIDIFDIFGMREIDRLIDNLKERDEIFEFEKISRKDIIASYKEEITLYKQQIKKVNESYTKSNKKWRKLATENQQTNDIDIEVLKTRLTAKNKDLDSVITTVNILKADLSRSKSDFKHSNLKVKNLENIIKQKELVYLNCHTVFGNFIEKINKLSGESAMIIEEITGVNF